MKDVFCKKKKMDFFFFYNFDPIQDRHECSQDYKRTFSIGYLWILALQTVWSLDKSQRALDRRHTKHSWSSVCGKRHSWVDQHMPLLRNKETWPKQ